MSRADLCRSLAVVADAPGPAAARHAEVLGLGRAPTAAEHTKLFTLELHPYASVHLGPEGQLGGVARDRVAGFFRALGAVPPPEPDHLVVLLHAYADLADLDERADASAPAAASLGGAAASEAVGTPAAGASPPTRARHARTVLLHEHLASWVPRFAGRAAELAPAPLRAWARLLANVLDAEAERLGDPPMLSAHLREAPALEEAVDEGRAAFVAALLAPVRSGFVLARTDLARAARDLGLGLRIGERGYALDALVDQDPRGTLSWMADEAARQREALGGRTDPASGFWRARLETTAELLTRLGAAGVPDDAPVRRPGADEGRPSELR